MIIQGETAEVVKNPLSDVFKYKKYSFPLNESYLQFKVLNNFTYFIENK